MEKEQPKLINSFGGIVHTLELRDPNVDDVLLYQTQALGFALKTGTLLSDVALEPVPRSVKDAFRGT